MLFQDFLAQIHRIGNFLGVYLSEKDKNRIVKTCSVESMQEASSQDKSGFKKLNVRKGELSWLSNCLLQVYMSAIAATRVA